LDIKNSIGHVSLLEDLLVFLKFYDRCARPYLGEKGLGTNPSPASFPTGASFAPMHLRASHYSDFNAENEVTT
jgi:hypothetical protein